MTTVHTSRTVRHPTRPRLRLVNAFTCWILRIPGVRRLADHQVAELRFVGRKTGRRIRLPVMYAQSGDQLVVLVGGPDGKQWWRNFRRPHPLQVLLRGTVRLGVGHVALMGTPERAEAAVTYASRYPDLPVRDDPIVVIILDGYSRR